MGCTWLMIINLFMQEPYRSRTEPMTLPLSPPAGRVRRQVIPFAGHGVPPAAAAFRVVAVPAGALEAVVDVPGILEHMGVVDDPPEVAGPDVDAGAGLDVAYGISGTGPIPIG